jgi:hypothetical protein
MHGMPVCLAKAGTASAVCGVKKADNMIVRKVRYEPVEVIYRIASIPFGFIFIIY